MEVQRNTHQCSTILSHLRSVKTHPTAEMVYQKVKEDIPAITLATVYRNLNKLADNGQILRIEINKEFHFDADLKPHQHCVCEKCGKIMDDCNAKISEDAVKHFDMKGFIPKRVNVIFEGICKDCS